MELLKNYFIPIVFVTYLLFKRIRTLLKGFQKYSPPALYIRIAVYLLIAFSVLIKLHSGLFLTISIATLTGVLLAFIAQRKVVFKKIDNIFCYQTPAWIELTIILLFIVRIVYRFYFLDFNADAKLLFEDRSIAQSLADSLTGFLFFVLCSYYIGYSIFILFKADAIIKRVRKTN